MNIPKWFATKDWNFLLSNFTATPSYLAIILNINRPVFRKPLMYDHLDLEANLLRDTFRENLDFSHNGKSVSFSSLSPELRLLTTIMFHNLYLLSSIGHMNLGRALFLYDLITDKEIDICSHIFHILSKTAKKAALRNCLPFYCLISKNLKLKSVHPLEDEYPHPK